MFRTFLASLIIACVATSVRAAITLDGMIGDWEQAGLLKTDPSNDKASATAAAEVLRSGATIEGGIFYAVVEINRPASDFNGANPGNIPPDSVNRLYLGAFIDADNSASTTLNGLGGHAAAGCTGTDILLEWGRNRRDPPVNFWGAEDDIGVGMTTSPATGSPGAAYADTDGGLDSYGLAGHGVLEWSCPVSSITAALATQVDNVTSGPIWAIRLGVQGLIPSDPLLGAWGYDYNTLAGDANWSNTVDVADLTNLLNNYNKPGTWTNGDFDGDGNVNVADLTALLNNYNKTNNVVPSGGSVQIAVPEPSSIVLLAMLSACVAAWIVRRRVR